MSTDTPRHVSRSAFSFFSGTLLSRISGMFRDMAMAFCFGTSASLAAFLLTYRFVYLIRRLFGEGLLHQGFIPHFETIRKHNPKEGALFFRDLFWTLTCLLGALLLFSEIFLIFATGEIPKLAALMLPGVFFICLFGLSSGLLQSEKNFFITSVAPVAFNFVWILGVIGLRHLVTHQAVLGLSCVLSVAFCIQWALTVPKTWKYLRSELSIKECFRAALFSPKLRSLMRPLLLGIMGVAAIQINSAIDGIFARCALLEGPAYLWYAIRLQQLPLALFGIALSSALLPSLSREAQNEDTSAFNRLLVFAQKRTFALVFPCVIGIFVLGAQSVNLLFGRGDFGQTATFQTTYCLWAYGLGLLPAACVQILAPAFYARKDYKTPTIAAIWTALLNTGLNAFLIFYFQLGVVSVALATSFAALFNMLYLYIRLKPEGKIFPSMAKVALCALIAGGVSLVLSQGAFGLLFSKNFTFVRGAVAQLVEFATAGAIYFGAFLALCKIFRVEDIIEIFSHLRSKTSGSQPHIDQIDKRS